MPCFLAASIASLATAGVVSDRAAKMPPKNWAAQYMPAVVPLSRAALSDVHGTWLVAIVSGGLSATDRFLTDLMKVFAYGKPEGVLGGAITLGLAQVIPETIPVQLEPSHTQVSSKRLLLSPPV